MENSTSTDLAHDLRIYFDALADRVETEAATEAAVTDARRPHWRSRLLLAVGAGAFLVVAMIVGSRNETRSESPTVLEQTGATSTPTINPGFTPNLGVDADVVATQADGPTVVLAAANGWYLTAERRELHICVQIRPRGASTGDESCAIPADSPWPDGNIFPVRLSHADNRVVVGAVSADVEPIITLDSPEPSAPEAAVGEVTEPFPTVRFFLFSADGDVVWARRPDHSMISASVR